MRKPIALAAAATALSAVAIATGTAAGAANAATAPAAATPGAIVHVDAAAPVCQNEIGNNHQAAQEDLQAHGFFNLRERDCAGGGRVLPFDRNWKVVRQSPRPARA